MRLFVPFIFLLIFYSLAMGLDKIPIPRESADYSEKYIIQDPESGDDIICNQIVIVFSEDINSTEQKNILKKISGNIIGGIPVMDMYQVRIQNNDVSLKKVERICGELEKNKKVVHASPRKLPTGNIHKIELENMKPVRRRGQLDLAPAERAAPEKEDKMVTTLQMHKANLYSCLKSTAIKQGSIEYRITINPSGKVTHIKILKSTFNDKNLKDCLSHKIRKWDDFPGFEKDYDRQLEFTFQF